MDRAPCGVISINKPLGKTSADVVNRVAWLLRKNTRQKRFKAGHCGTLDPLATGVLLVCVGTATRLVSLIQEHSKRYRGRFALGLVTDTDDLEGRVLRDVPPPTGSIRQADLEALLPEFRGEIQQVPPRFSAVHVDGQRAYELARKGREIEIAPRDVVINRMDVTAFDLPHFELDIECGSGTYIRSIGRDLGAKLGCGATMIELARTAIGPFTIDAAQSLDELTIDNVTAAVQSPLLVLPHLPQYSLSEQEIYDIRRGRFVTRTLPLPESASDVCLLDATGELAAIAKFDREADVLRPALLLIEAAH